MLILVNLSLVMVRKLKAKKVFFSLGEDRFWSVNFAMVFFMIWSARQQLSSYFSAINSTTRVLSFDFYEGCDPDALTSYQSTVTCFSFLRKSPDFVSFASGMSNARSDEVMMCECIYVFWSLPNLFYMCEFCTWSGFILCCQCFFPSLKGIIFHSIKFHFVNAFIK